MGVVSLYGGRSESDGKQVRLRKVALAKCQESDQDPYHFVPSEVQASETTESDGEVTISSIIIFNLPRLDAQVQRTYKQIHTLTK